MTFINLSNHPLSTWSEKQINAAKALKLGELVKLEGGMPMVPACATTLQVAAMAEDIVARAIAQGARGAFVAGEFTLCYALVGLLRSKGVRCFCATTSRKATEEVDENGLVFKTSVFDFVMWREYP